MAITRGQLSRATVGRLTLLGNLYFAQGLPFGFFVQALPALLRDAGYSLGEIGLASLLAIPWALKFLWAPFVDRRYWPRLGRRRTWILGMQLAATLVLGMIAIAPGSDALPVLMTAMFLLNLIAATQDVATDGLAVAILPPAERGFANGLQVGAYRIGMIMGGGVLLGVYADHGLHTTFAVMTVLTILSSVPVLVAREPDVPIEKSGSPHVHFLLRPGAWRLIALVVVYKAGEAFAQGMLRPFLKDRGLDLHDIAWMLGAVGFTAGTAGALAGGALVGRIGRRRSLVAFGIGQVITVAGYAYLAFGTPSYAEIATWLGVEHFASGMATAALFTSMMDWSRPESGGTDYTVQASAVVIASGVASALSGFSAQALGYGPHFVVATVLCAVAIAVVARLYPEEVSR
ncbi:MAG: MFS transporter [Kofleriaceae bacterium]|nr:MFS transporter [Kofleriaceae bacterium]